MTIRPIPLIIGRNLASLDYESDLGDRATEIDARCAQLAGKDTFLGNARFRVSSWSSGPKTFTPVDPTGAIGPVGFDDQLIGFSILREKDAQLYEITDTVKGPPNVITLATAPTGFANGEYFSLRDEDGLVPHRLRHPLYSADTYPGIGPKALTIDRSSLIAVSNIMPNPVFREWSDPATKMPDGWRISKRPFDASWLTSQFTDTVPDWATITRNTDPLYRQTGDASLQFSFPGALILSPPIVWSPQYAGQRFSTLMQQIMTSWSSMPSAYMKMHWAIERTDGAIVPWLDPGVGIRVSPLTSPPAGTKPLAGGDWTTMGLPAMDISNPVSATWLYPTQSDIDSLSVDSTLLLVLWIFGSNLGTNIAGVIDGVTVTPSDNVVPAVTEFGDANAVYQDVQTALERLATQYSFSAEVLDLKRMNDALDEEELDRGNFVAISSSDFGIVNDVERITDARINDNVEGDTVIVVEPRLKKFTQRLIQGSKQTAAQIATVATGTTTPPSGGTSTPPSGGGTSPASPSLSLSLTITSHVPLVTALLGGNGVKVKFYASSTALSIGDATTAVNGETAITTAPFQYSGVDGSGTPIEPGETWYFYAIAYDAADNPTDLSSVSVSESALTFGAHAYWRFRNQRAQNTLQFSAMGFRDSSGSAIATTGGTPIASGTNSGAIANLFDGNNATGWESDVVGQFAWCGYQFATPQTVMQISLQRSTGQNTPTNGRMEYSDDGVVWAEAVWVEVGTLTADTPKWFDFNNALRANTTFGTHAYWRMFTPIEGFSGLSALLFKDAAGSTIATTGGTAIGTNTDSAHDMSKAFDGVDSTWWNSEFFSNTPFAYQWVGYLFATPQTVMQMATQRTSGMTQDKVPCSCAFQFSDDGVVWGTACWANPSNSTNDTPEWFNFANALPVNTGTDFGAHQHWKVQTFIGTLLNVFGNLFNTGWCALAEIGFKDASGSTISLTGITPHAFSGSPANAFDGNVSTLWEENDIALPWVSAEFPADQTVMQVMLERNSTQDESSHANEPREVQFMWSDNGKEWVNVATALTAPMTNSVPKWFDLAQVL